MKTPPFAGPWDQILPSFGELTNEVLFGDIWERPGLSKRDRSLITVAALTALYRSEQLRNHIIRALENGLSKAELAELFQHMAFYGGWPVAVNAFRVADEVFKQDDR